MTKSGSKDEEESKMDKKELLRNVRIKAGNFDRTFKKCRIITNPTDESFLLVLDNSRKHVLRKDRIEWITIG